MFSILFNSIRRILSSDGKDVNDFAYCTANPGYRIVQNYYSTDFFLRNTSEIEMYSLQKCDKCFTKTVCDTLSVIEYNDNIDLVCAPGLYISDKTISQECMPCPLDVICTGNGDLNTFPNNETTLDMNSKIIDACICGKEGFYKNTQHQCVQILILSIIVRNVFHTQHERLNIAKIDMCVKVR